MFFKSAKYSAVFVLFFVTFVLLFSCAGKKSLTTRKVFAEPDYELSAVRFIDIDMERLNLEVDLKISNPNYISLQFQNVNYQLNIDGSRVLSGVLTEALEVPAKGEYMVTIPFTVRLDKLENGALNLMMSRRLKYALSTNLDSSAPILEKTSFTVKRVDELTF